MRRFRKSSGCILLFTLTLLLFSCGGGDNSNEPKNQDVQNSTESITETTAEKITYDVPDSDFGGYNFRVVDREGFSGYWVTVDMYSEAENGDPINDAVFQRNMVLEDKFNINITEIRQSDVLSYVEKIIYAGSDDFDVFYPTMQQAGAMIQNGLIVNLYDVPYLAFDKPWWNKITNDTMTVAGKLYCAAGNITTTTNDATLAVLFNKDLNTDYGLEDPYAVVRDGKWTLDVLHGNSKLASKDLDGNGTLEPEDQWGAVEQRECAYSLFAASGQRMIEKNGDDLPVLSLNSDRTISVLTKVINFMSDDEAQIKADDYYDKYANVWNEITMKVFNESRALYLITNFDMVKTLRNMDANFGILPLPKYDDSQKQYYSVMQYNNATVMCVPMTAGNLERTGTILEAWAAESVDTLTKAYYDIQLKGKLSRDAESEEMLDLIFSTRIIDQGILFNWSNAQGFFIDFAVKKTMNFASEYAKFEQVWLNAIEKTIAAIEENN